jgi:hypothetical protein
MCKWGTKVGSDWGKLAGRPVTTFSLFHFFFFPYLLLIPHEIQKICTSQPPTLAGRLVVLVLSSLKHLSF